MKKEKLIPKTVYLTQKVIDDIEKEAQKLRSNFSKVALARLEKK